MTPPHNRIQISTTPRFQQMFAHLSKQAQRTPKQEIRRRVGAAIEKAFDEEIPLSR